MAVERTKSVRKPKPRYITTDGEWVPGVTTVIGLRAKDALVPWAFKIGKENPELSSIREYVDELASIGSAAHEIIGAHLLGADPDLRDFTPATVEAAAIPVSKYREWAKGKDIQIIASEKQYVSDRFRFGGTVDVLAKIDGVTTILDFKTGKAIYDEMFYQVAAYAELVAETGLRVDAIRILQIGRTGAEGFTERVMTDWSLEWEWFKAMRAVYQVEMDLKLDSRKNVIPITDGKLKRQLRESIDALAREVK